jgi:hypothetical protein
MGKAAAGQGAGHDLPSLRAEGPVLVLGGGAANDRPGETVNRSPRKRRIPDTAALAKRDYRRPRSSSWVSARVKAPPTR